MIKRLKFDKKNCMGCQLCMQVCSAMHENIFSPAKARLHITSNYDGGNLVTRAGYCTLCGLCQKNCPTGAIKVGSRVSVDQELCTQCGECALKCPQKVISIREGNVNICDHCGGDTWCVQYCPHHALKYE